MTHPDIPPAIRGTFAALGHPASIAHLTRLGVTTVELMPSAAWVDERHLPPLNLSNYWGYNPIAFLAPDPRLAPGGWPEVRAAVDALARGRSKRRAGRGAEPHRRERRARPDAVAARPGQCRLLPAGQATGRSMSTMPAAATSWRWTGPSRCALGWMHCATWALYGGIDGFRLDLAATLGRRETGFDPNAPLLDRDRAGPGAVPPRDDRRTLGHRPRRLPAWRVSRRAGASGTTVTATPCAASGAAIAGMLGDFTTRFAGSADVFARARPLTRSINFITAHDGFTLARSRLVHGEAQRRRTARTTATGRTTTSPGTMARRVRRPIRRSIRHGRATCGRLLATLLLSRGTPMLSMGDELGRTQHGNNNAYAQDNAESWFDWASANSGLIEFTAAAIDLRRDIGAAVRWAVVARSARGGCPDR